MPLEGLDSASSGFCWHYLSTKGAIFCIVCIVQFFLWTFGIRVGWIIRTPNSEGVYFQPVRRTQRSTGLTKNVSINATLGYAKFWAEVRILSASFPTTSSDSTVSRLPASFSGSRRASSSCIPDGHELYACFRLGSRR